jgi:hypothetical protein
MAFLPSIIGIELIGVADPGIPNQERIIIRAQYVNLAQYAVIVGLKNEKGLINPTPDHFYWLGDVEISESTWIIIYTGPGSFKVTKAEGTGEIVHVAHLGKDKTIFNNANVVPAIINLGGIIVGSLLSPPGTKS